MQVLNFHSNCTEPTTINSENSSLEKLIISKTDIVNKTNHGDVLFVDNLEHSIGDLFVRNIIMANANYNDNIHIHKHVYKINGETSQCGEAKKRRIYSNKKRI